MTEHPPPRSSLDAARDSLLAAVDAAKLDHVWDTERLERAVRDFAAARRAAGDTPERFITELKTLLRRDALADVGDWFQSVVVNRLVVWGIEGYYAIDGGCETPMPDSEEHPG